MSEIKSNSDDLVLNSDGGTSTIKFQTNGVERASISSDGKVGVGTVSPARPLEVKDSTDIANIRLQGSVGYCDLSGNGGNGSDFVVFTEGTEKFRVKEAGGIRATDGILFGSDTAAANALDDYEEGNWTPTWSPTNGSWSGTGVGKYTKVGRQVTASFNWLASSQATGTKFNAVGGLPFTSLNETATYPAIVTMNGGGASGNMLNATVRANSTSVNLQMQPDGTGTHGEFTPAQTNSSCEISLTVTYMTT